MAWNVWVPLYILCKNNCNIVYWNITVIGTFFIKMFLFLVTWIICAWGFIFCLKFSLAIFAHRDSKGKVLIYISMCLKEMEGTREVYRLKIPFLLLNVIYWFEWLLGDLVWTQILSFSPQQDQIALKFLLYQRETNQTHTQGFIHWPKWWGKGLLGGWQTLFEVIVLTQTDIESWNKGSTVLYRQWSVCYQLWKCSRWREPVYVRQETNPFQEVSVKVGNEEREREKDRERNRKSLTGAPVSGSSFSGRCFWLQADQGVSEILDNKWKR